MRERQKSSKASEAPFRPERFAILASCTEAFDIVNLKVVHCSVFAGYGSGAPIPAAEFATDAVCEIFAKVAKCNALFFRQVQS